MIGRVHVDKRRAFCTTGAIANPENKPVPTEFRPCTDFVEKQNQTFSQVDDIQRNPEAPIPFYSRHLIQTMGRNLRPSANEHDLRKRQAGCVEEIVRLIIQDHIEHREHPGDFHLGADCRLEHHTKLLMAGEEKSEPSNTKYVDKTYILKTEGVGDRLVFIIEYKVPHKLTLKVLGFGLNGLNDLSFTDRITRAKTSNNPELQAEVYSYIIERGLRYAYLTIGEAFVFLTIDPDDLNTL